MLRSSARFARESQTLDFSQIGTVTMLNGDYAVVRLVNGVDCYARFSSLEQEVVAGLRENFFVGMNVSVAICGDEPPIKFKNSDQKVVDMPMIVIKEAQVIYSHKGTITALFENHAEVTLENGTRGNVIFSSAQKRALKDSPDYLHVGKAVNIYLKRARKLVPEMLLEDLSYAIQTTFFSISLKNYGSSIKVKPKSLFSLIKEPVADKRLAIAIMHHEIDTGVRPAPFKQAALLADEKTARKLAAGLNKKRTLTEPPVNKPKAQEQVFPASARLSKRGALTGPLKLPSTTVFTKVSGKPLTCPSTIKFPDLVKPQVCDNKNILDAVIAQFKIFLAVINPAKDLKSHEILLLNNFEEILFGESTPQEKIQLMINEANRHIMSFAERKFDRVRVFSTTGRVEPLSKLDRFNTFVAMLDPKKINAEIVEKLKGFSSKETLSPGFKCGAAWP